MSTWRSNQLSYNPSEALFICIFIAQYCQQKLMKKINNKPLLKKYFSTEAIPSAAK